MINSQKVCGIIGGLGPSATADLYRLVIKNTLAKKDQDHLRLLIDSHPQIADRTAAILNGGESPLAGMLESAKILANAGADFLAIPCNTAHYFVPELESQIDLPVINMIKETADFISKNGWAKVGLLSTSGTAKSGVYQKFMDEYNFQLLIPNNQDIENEMEAIYGDKGIKAGSNYEKSAYNKNLFIEVMNNLKANGADAIIMGCTEIPLCLDDNDFSLPLINPTEILAKAIVSKAR